MKKYGFKLLYYEKVKKLSVIFLVLTEIAAVAFIVFGVLDKMQAALILFLLTGITSLAFLATELVIWWRNKKYPYLAD